MKAQLGKQTGLALALLATLLATLLAMGVFSVAQAQASPSASRSFEPATVQPGGDVVVTIAISDFGQVGRVEETLPAGFTYVRSNLTANPTGNQVEFLITGGINSFTYVVSAPDTEGDYTFSGRFQPRSGADWEPVVGVSMVTVSALSDNANLSDLSLSAGTLMPEFAMDTMAYTASVGYSVESVTVTAMAADDNATVSGDGEHTLMVGENTITVTVTAEDGSTTMTYTVTVTRAQNGSVEPESATSSDTPGAAVRVTLSGDMEAAAGQIISVKFPSAFGVPSSIAPDSVLITSGGETGNPNDVSVNGSTVELLITDISATAGAQGVSGNSTIIFGTRAGITNPTKASSMPDTYVITVDSEGDADDIVANAIVNREISLDPKEGPSGADVTVTGKGYSDGTATVFIDKNEDGAYDDGEEVGSAVITGGTFTLTTTALKKGTGADAPDSLMVNAVDSANAVAPTSATYTFKAGFTVKPATASWGEKVTITLGDWPSGDTVSSVRFGGSGADQADATHSGSTVTTTVPDNVRPGKLVLQLLNAQGTLYTPTGSIEIVPLGLSVSPSSVVPGQQVTIRGSKFVALTAGQNIDVTIGGKPAEVPADADVTSAGRIAVSVDVPLDVGTGDKKVIVTAGNREGQGSITVAKPSLSVDPTESLPGTTITVTGTGFASSARIEVLYGPTGSEEDGIEEVGTTDSSGNMRVRMDVPAGLDPGSNNKVRVQVRGYEDVIYATADHGTPGAMIMVTEVAQAGGTITINGSNFEAFSVLERVEVADQNAMPSPAPETDKNGMFEIQVRVPRLDPGSHTVTVEDGDENTATETFTVTDTPVVETPAEVFGGLGDTLVVVWRYDNATATWASYSPDAPAELNDLTGVSRGNIVWIQVSANAGFQGGNLYAGWNLITLE